MTPERHQQITEIVTKLKHCKATCDELYNDEDGQQHDLLKNRHQLAADKCGRAMSQLFNAEDSISKAIEELEGIEG